MARGALTKEDRITGLLWAGRTDVAGIAKECRCSKASVRRRMKMQGGHCHMTKAIQIADWIQAPAPELRAWAQSLRSSFVKKE